MFTRFSISFVPVSFDSHGYWKQYTVAYVGLCVYTIGRHLKALFICETKLGRFISLTDMPFKILVQSVFYLTIIYIFQHSIGVCVFVFIGTCF